MSFRLRLPISASYADFMREMMDYAVIPQKIFHFCGQLR
jgi:hypothetical protein